MSDEATNRSVAMWLRGARRRMTRGSLLNAARLRIISALILFTFLLLHLINHSLGLVSIDAMEAMRQMRIAVTRSTLGTGILVLAATVHFVLGISRLMQVQTWRIGRWTIVQLVFGLLFPFLLIRHVVGTRGVNELFGIHDDYVFVLWSTWPGDGWNLALMITLGWVHACIGLNNWLAGKAWYHTRLWLWYGLAVLIPALAYAGYVSAAQKVRLEFRVPDPIEPGQYARALGLINDFRASYLIVLGLALFAWALLLVANRLGSRIAISYTNGTTVRVPRGLSLLAISRINDIPHASVCGGRARCSTCRVRVLAGQENLPPPSERELQVLRRVGAPPNVRLACQVYPTGDMTISTLLPAQMTRGGSQTFDQYLWGVEHEVTIMFCDLRGFTSLSEGRLTYDVVFLLNQFLGRMAEAIEDTGGFVDKFMGDGIMAIFGKDSSADDGARQAIAAVRAMGGVLDALNQSLHEALPAPMSMGIGLHTGPAILGRIGAVEQNESGGARLTALGETVNLASRLEGKAKEMNVQVVLSAATAEHAGLSGIAEFRPELTEVRGFAQPVLVHAIRRATQLPGAETPA
jgi:adenylate cyclase